MLGNHVLDKRSALDWESEAHEESFLLRAGMIDLRIPLYHLLSAHRSVVALTVEAYAIACDLLPHSFLKFIFLSMFHVQWHTASPRFGRGI